MEMSMSEEIKERMHKPQVLELDDGDSGPRGNPGDPVVYGSFPVVATRIGIPDPYLYVLLNRESLSTLKLALSLAFEKGPASLTPGQMVAVRVDPFRKMGHLIQINR